MLAAVAGGMSASGASAAAPDWRAEYQKTVKPFLAQHCFKCHDTREAQAGLRLDELGSEVPRRSAHQERRNMRERLIARAACAGPTAIAVELANRTATA